MTVNFEKGYGFLRGDHDHRLYFFHCSTVEQKPFIELQPKRDRVEFESTETEKGPRAMRVAVCSS